ncbi:MAG: beta-glycosidase, partial [Bacteroidales bacterium]|nr:beta-glycosidase [Bacteroidales bacterium]
MKPVKIFGNLLFATVISVFVLSCSVNDTENIRITHDLSGIWQFSTDEGKKGIQEKWYQNTFTDSITLPGSMDENKKGWLNKDTTHMHLNRAYKYYGAAWYKKDIEVPEDWTGKHIELIMERTKVTHVWFDTTYLGSNNTIFSKQVYDLTGVLAPGKHQLTIMVDNDINLVPVAGSHAYEENMQTNWNGILGRFCIEVSNPARIHTVRTYPDIDSKSVKVLIKTLNEGEQLTGASITLKAELWNTHKKHLVKAKSFTIEVPKGENSVELDYPLGEKAVLWSEFEPALYRLSVELKSGKNTIDCQILDFGLREFKAPDTQFTINGLTSFLRGKHDGCMFPLTGYPPMDTAGWNRVFRIAKS